MVEAEGEVIWPGHRREQPGRMFVIRQLGPHARSVRRRGSAHEFVVKPYASDTVRNSGQG